MRTPLAVVGRSCICIASAMLLVAWTPMAAPQTLEVPTLDFRHTVLPEPDPLGRPLMTIGATTDRQEIPPRHSLPLELSIVRTSKAPGVGDLGALEIDVRIENKSTEVFYLPISVDPLRRSILPGNANRRIFSLSARFHSEGDTGRAFGIRWDGSDSVPESLFELMPGEAVVIKLKASLSSLWRWRENGRDTVEMTIEADEKMLEEDEFTVSSWAPELTTANAVVVSLDP